MLHPARLGTTIAQCCLAVDQKQYQHSGCVILPKLLRNFPQLLPGCVDVAPGQISNRGTFSMNAFKCKTIVSVMRTTQGKEEFEQARKVRN